jgi:POT family proton-dependent oligopeptide transporter
LSTTSEYAAPGDQTTGGKTFFGQPRGLATLFFTEMWERFSYYGMRAFLILFMVASVDGANPGLGFGEGMSGALYGLYTSMVYLLTLPGGWVADNLWGQRKAVFRGGVIIAIGHFTLAAPLVGAPDRLSFFLGLLFIVIGTGLLKPNVSTMVGDLYPRLSEDATDHERKVWGANRDAAFSIFYMGINVGAMLGPFICGTLGEGINWPAIGLVTEGNWHLGFSIAGFGMILGLIQYRMGDKYLGEAGLFKPDAPQDEIDRRGRNFYFSAGAVAAVTALVVFLLVTDALGMTIVDFATWIAYGIVLLSIVFFAYLILSARWAASLVILFAILCAVFVPRMGVEGGQWAAAGTLGTFVLMCLGLLTFRGDQVTTDQKRLMVIYWLFLLAAVFWAGFEQAGSSMNLFAENDTNRVLVGWEINTTWLQNVNPFFVVVLAPVFGSLWTWLAHRDMNPSTPRKFALGLMGLAAGMFVLAWGASYAVDGTRVSMAWLVVTYFFFTCGELALSPIGLSAMTKLAPRGRLGQMMGVWFIASALGSLVAGLVAAQLETLPAVTIFTFTAIFAGATGLVALLVSPLVNRLMGQVE